MSVRTGWSKNKDDWKRLSQCIEENEIKWKKNKFSAQTLNIFPDRPGVYMFCTTPPKEAICKSGLNVFLTPLYVGKSADGLKNRLRQHYKNPQPSIKEVFDIFSSNLIVIYAECDVSILSELEDSLIIAFGPITNRNHAMSVRTRGEIKAKLDESNKITIIGG